mgnify:FL=1
MEERAMIFIDGRNIIQGQKTYRKEGNRSDFGYSELMEYFAIHYKVIRGYYYDGAPHPSQYTPEREKLYNFMRRCGITLRLKEIDFSRPGHSQKGVDIYLAADMISLAYENAYDSAVIVSGDGDYCALVELVKSKGKKVTVLSFACCLANTLSEVADQVLLIENIPDLHRRQQ